jgi:hypothetical protein
MTDLESLLNQLNRTPDKALPSVKRILAGLQDERFSGIVELKYEAGRIILMRKSEASKPSQNDGDPANAIDE